MTEEATPEQVVEFMTNVMKTTPEQIITMLQAEIERLKIESNDRFAPLLTQIIAMRAEVERLKAEKIRTALDVMKTVTEMRAEVERLTAENARLKEIEIRYDQLISGAFI